MSRIGIVVIGRNEAARLELCLRAALREAPGAPVVYVDSGSSDDSAGIARRMGVTTIVLDDSTPFTAARGRNVGLDALGEVELVQFIDGDCELRRGWLDVATDFLDRTPAAVIVCGRVREANPEASVYNRLCDAEWDVAPGRVSACGGIFLARAAALRAVGGFNPRLVAREEDDLCLRLMAEGGDIWRLPDEMVWHDADLTRFGQWWTRMQRFGHALAETVEAKGALDPRAHASARRALLWASILPVSLLGILLLGPISLLLLLAYPAQILRMARRAGYGRAAWETATFLTLGKFAEVQGMLGHWRSRRGRPRQRRTA